MGRGLSAPPPEGKSPGFPCTHTVGRVDRHNQHGGNLAILRKPEAVSRLCPSNSAPHYLLKKKLVHVGKETWGGGFHCHTVTTGEKWSLLFLSEGVESHKMEYRRGDI